MHSKASILSIVLDRAFQGWLSLSNSGPGRGTLRVLPLLREATAYWMLRPFLPDVPRCVQGTYSN